VATNTSFDRGLVCSKIVCRQTNCATIGYRPGTTFFTLNAYRPVVDIYITNGNASYLSNDRLEAHHSGVQSTSRTRGNEHRQMAPRPIGGALGRQCVRLDRQTARLNAAAAAQLQCHSLGGRTARGRDSKLYAHEPHRVDGWCRLRPSDRVCRGRSISQTQSVGRRELWRQVR